MQVDMQAGYVFTSGMHTGKLIGDRALMGSAGSASGIAFDPSGHMLAATGPDGVLLKKLGTQEEPERLPLLDATTWSSTRAASTSSARPKAGRRVMLTRQHGYTVNNVPP